MIEPRFRCWFQLRLTLAGIPRRAGGGIGQSLWCNFPTPSRANGKQACDSSPYRGPVPSPPNQIYLHFQARDSRVFSEVVGVRPLRRRAMHRAGTAIPESQAHHLQQHPFQRKLLQRMRQIGSEPCVESTAPESNGAGEFGLAMLRALSTHLFLNQRLHSAQLELASRSGAQAVELFAARQHFDYTDRDHVAELASWFASSPLEAMVHATPRCSSDREMGRKQAYTRSQRSFILEKARRIAAMDEIKRALETAESIPFRNLIVHLGERDDGWSLRSLLEYAETALGTPQGAPWGCPSARCSHPGRGGEPGGVKPTTRRRTWSKFWSWDTSNRSACVLTWAMPTLPPA